MKLKHIAGVLIAVSALVCASSCTMGGRYMEVSGFAQGGTYRVKMNLSGVDVPPDVIRTSIDSILTLVDTTLSGYNKGSQLSRFNSGEHVDPSPVFRDMYSYCYALYEETDGALDVASGPLFDLWGFGFRNDSLPSSEDVERVLAACGMKRLAEEMPACRVSASDLLLPESGDALPVLNFNAVAQGYTCDLVASYLHSVGVKDMLVDIGEIYCEGKNPYGKGWNIGVDRPVDGNENPGADLDGIWVSDGNGCGIVTSGNYRKFYIRDGKKYAHTIDPGTGYPVDHNLLSATVVAPNAAMADAYATYCMVIGFDSAKSFINSRPDLEAYLIYDDGGVMKEWNSAGFTIVR